ncbi:MAG: ribose-phosphate diphosphokinase [Candidatus Bathyarchaeota archaeon]
MIVVPGPASKELGLKVAEILGVNRIDVEAKFFPDGETYIRFMGEVKGEDLILIQSTYHPQDTHIMQLILLTETALNLGAKTVTVVVPYMAYSRQDKVFRPFEAVSIQTLINLIGRCGASRLLTIDIHEPKVFDGVKIQAENLSAMPAFIDYFLKENLNGAVSFAPDKKAVKMATQIDETLQGGYGWFVKERDRVSGEIKMTCESEFDIKGKNVIVIDDIISSGKTTAMAVRMLKEMGAKRVFSACVHPLLAGNAYEKIIGNGADAVIGTDTIPNKINVVTVAPVIAEAVKLK